MVDRDASSPPEDAGGLTATDSGLDRAGAVAVSAGCNTACAITTSGGVECWMAGGDAAAAPVTDLAQGVTTVTVGGSCSALNHFACANAMGTVECWGDDTFGELGNGSTVASPSIPEQVVDLGSGVMGLSAGATGLTASVCAITSSGSVACWGGNDEVFGDASSASYSDVPVPIAGFAGPVTAVAVGNGFACAIVAGAVQCWGSNGGGQLGNGSTTDSPEPVQVVGLTSGASAITAGYGFACVLTTAGGVECWGTNVFGELGDNALPSSPVPVQVSGLTSGVTAVSAGNNTACAITAGGAVECWGDNISGQLGSDVPASQVPVQVTGLASGMTAVSVGDGFACAVKNTGGVWCWGGSNSSTSYLPVHVMGFPE